MTAPAAVARMSQASRLEFQAIDVNPYFKKNKEILLVLRKNASSVIEYRITEGANPGTQANLGEVVPAPVMLFPYGDSIAVLWNGYQADGEFNGFYVISLPLKDDQTLGPIITPKSSQFPLILKAFRISANGQTRQDFCNANNAFATFYEQYAGICGTGPLRYTFQTFWPGFPSSVSAPASNTNSTGRQQ